MSTLTQSYITLFIKEWEKQMEKTKNELRNMDIFKTISSVSGTNAVTAYLKSPNELPKAISKINKIPNISLYYTQPNHLEEVNDAIKKHEYFKAFTLCDSLYESFGKNILVVHFKERHLSLNSNRIEKLGIQSVILMLYTHKLIEEGTYSQMLSVNSVRNELVHRYMPSMISEGILNEIKQNTPNIMRSLRKLNEINESMRKK
jgi:hypothetical protein